MKRTRKSFSWPSPQPWKHFSFSTCFHSAWNHLCSFLWLFQGYSILLILKHVFFFFFFLPALPQWVRMINDTQMDSGEKLRWECKATGRPRPTYRWLRNGLPLMSQVPIVPWNTLLHISHCSMWHQNIKNEITLTNSTWVYRPGLHMNMEYFGMMFLHIPSFYRVELRY